MDRRLPGAQQSGSTAGVKTPYLDIAPRFGFAATLKHNFVLRGGMGLTFFPINYSSNYSLKNAPGNFNANCQIQNEAGTNTACQAPYASGVVAQYGLPVFEFNECRRADAAVLCSRLELRCPSPTSTW